VNQTDYEDALKFPQKLEIRDSQKPELHNSKTRDWQDSCVVIFGFERLLSRYRIRNYYFT
jgi:hypothetical protein